MLTKCSLTLLFRVTSAGEAVDLSQSESNTFPIFRQTAERDAELQAAPR